MAADGEPQGEAHVVGAHGAGHQAGEIEELRGLGPLDGPQGERGLRVGGGGEGAGDLAERLGEGAGLDLVPGGEPGPAVAHQADGEAFLMEDPEPRHLSLGRQLEVLPALEEGVDQVLRLLGDLGEGAGDGGGIQLSERHDGPLWHRKSVLV